MLSNPTNNLRNRQRLHRRQISTPSANEPAKLFDLPPNNQRNLGHRRGLSLDQRRRKTTTQERIANNVNTKYSPAPQHILRETQQQRLVCPGQQCIHFNNNETSLNSPIITPHRLSLDVNYMNQYGENVQRSPHQFAYLEPMGWNMEVQQRDIHVNNDFNIISADPTHSSAYLEYSNIPENNIESSVLDVYDEGGSTGRRISLGISDRVTQFENLALQSPHRPLTPSNHNLVGHFPPTPIDTPHVGLIKQEMINARFMDEYDTSMEETIKPSSKQRACGIFNDMRKELESNSQSCHINSSPLNNHIPYESMSGPVDDLMNLSNLKVELLDSQNQFGTDQLFSPDTTDISSVLSGYHSSTEDGQCPVISDPLANSIDGSNLQNNSTCFREPNIQQHMTSLSPKRRPSHRRFDSNSTINLEESITETGITIDEIASYISGPDPIEGGKWLCMYPGCRKRFGRKENIKSHVQTHLGDRQFQCPFCKKCFVRQHDLKRHAKIHSGIKPYPCQCGNTFARHDALTRHRQRGMCIGAFEGVVKKAAKRGRPRKIRPNDVENINPSPRTQRNKQAVSVSSSNSQRSRSRDSNSYGESTEIHDIKSSTAFDFKTPLAFDDTQFQLTQASLTLSNQLFSSITDTNSPRHPRISKHPDSSSMTMTPLTTDVVEPYRENNHPNTHHSSPQVYDSLSSPESICNYFDLEPSQNLNVMQPNAPNIPGPESSEGDLFLNLYSSTGQSSDMHSSRRDSEFLVEKYGDPFGQATGDDDLFSSSQYVLFGSP